MSESIAKEESTNPLRIVRIEKVTLNIATGKSGEPLEKAKKVLTQLTNKTPTTKQAKKAIKDFGVRKGEPIAAVVTLGRPGYRIRSRAIRPSKIGRNHYVSKEDAVKFMQSNFGTSTGN